MNIPRFRGLQSTATDMLQSVSRVRLDPKCSFLDRVVMIPLWWHTYIMWTLVHLWTERLNIQPGGTVVQQFWFRSGSVYVFEFACSSCVHACSHCVLCLPPTVRLGSDLFDSECVVVFLVMFIWLGLCLCPMSARHLYEPVQGLSGRKRLFYLYLITFHCVSWSFSLVSKFKVCLWQKIFQLWYIFKWSTWPVANILSLNLHDWILNLDLNVLG